MTHAYDRFFLPGFMKNMGFAVDFAVNGCNVSADSFYDFFIASKVANEIENGSPIFVCGCSGTELALTVFERVGFSAGNHSSWDKIGSKDINRASGKTINDLATVLRCNFYDVMELDLSD